MEGTDKLLDKLTTKMVKEATRAFTRIRPILAGKPAGVQGAILADLLSMWLAGHFGDTPEATIALRRTLLREHVKAVRQLIPVQEKIVLSEWDIDPYSTEGRVNGKSPGL